MRKTRNHVHGFIRVLAVASILAVMSVGFISVAAQASTGPDGSLDTSFSGDGKVTTDFGASYDKVNAVAVQADGKIVAAGQTYDFSSGVATRFALARYNTDGSLDTSFSGDGQLTTDFGGSEAYAFAVAIQADGKIVAAGRIQADVALARYNTDGTLDTTFSGDGKLTTSVGGEASFTGVSIQPDDRIVAAGWAQVGLQHDFLVARYNTDGTLDTTFSGGGVLTTNIGPSLDDYASGVALQGDGKIVIAGSSFSDSRGYFALARYNTDGTLDSSFGTGGVLTTAIGSSYDGADAVAVQADGKIVAGGFSQGATRAFALIRYNTDGTLDTTFSGDGELTTPMGTEDYLMGLALQRDRKIVAAGICNLAPGGHREFCLVRYNIDGTLDTTFGDGGTPGTVGTSLSSGDDEANAVAIQSDGKIVAAGDSPVASSLGYSDFALVRYNNSNGSDTPAGNLPLTDVTTSGGTFTTDPGGLGATTSVPVQTSIVVLPSATGGTVQITAGPTTDPAPTGYSFFGNQVNITSTVTGTTSAPLVLTFTIEGTTPGADPSTLSVVRTESGSSLTLPFCTGAAGSASPDPCMSAPETITSGPAAGDIKVTVYTTHASDWNFAVHAPYTLGGFFAPVDNRPIVNLANAGSAIPVKFSLGGNQGLGVFARNYPASGMTSCDSTATIDAIEQTVTANASGLTYATNSGQYNYTWKTQKAWAGTCRQLEFKFIDGSVMRANFKFK